MVGRLPLRYFSCAFHEFAAPRKVPMASSRPNPFTSLPMHYCTTHSLSDFCIPFLEVLHSCLTGSCAFAPGGQRLKCTAACLVSCLPHSESPARVSLSVKILGELRTFAPQVSLIQSNRAPSSSPSFPPLFFFRSSWPFPGQSLSLPPDVPSPPSWPESPAVPFWEILPLWLVGGWESLKIFADVCVRIVCRSCVTV